MTLKAEPKRKGEPILKLPINNWPFLCIGTLLSIVFFLFGLRQLIASYFTDDPHSFLMLFFSSSMIILINGTIFSILLVLGFKKYRGHNDSKSKTGPGVVIAMNRDVILYRHPAVIAWISAFLFRLLRLLGLIILRCCFNFRVYCRHGVPLRTPYIVIANHVSFMDPVVLQSACPHRIIFLMTERYYNPLPVRWFFNLMCCIPLNEDTPYNIRALRMGLEALEKGNVLGIFPEGSISREGVLRDAMPGTILLAQKASVPIVPAYIEGTYQALPRHARFFRKANISVSFGIPLAYEELSGGLPGKEGLQAATKNLMSYIERLASSERDM